METAILEKTIIKLGSLLALGFGEAGANIIGHCHPAVVKAIREQADRGIHYFGTLNDLAVALADKLVAAGTEFIIEPGVRFKGQPGEQGTFFLLDPAGNALEFKYFDDIGRLFAT